jgi:hypothetical protein
MAEIIDFSDLAQATKFSFQGITYEIPAISNKKAMALFEMSKTVAKKNKEDKEKVDEENNTNKEDKEKVDEENNAYIGFQIKYICASVKNCSTGQFLTEEEVSEWPMKLTNKITNLINKSLSGSFEENTEEEKKS